jgi:hypothetical protein
MTKKRKKCLTCGECFRFRGGIDICKVESDWDACEGFRPATNGDRIRAMSNNELAVLLNQCDYMINEAFKGERELFSSCYDMWLKWLNAPADAPDTNVGTKESEVGNE